MATIVTRAGKGSPLTNAEVDANFTNLDTSKLELSGGTLTGFLTLHASPTQALHPATKDYVDNLATGFKTAPQVRAATTTNLSANYDNGTAGVGATLTADTNRVFTTLDGVTGWAIGNGILVKNQTAAYANGRYILTDVGSASTPWVLTRCSLCDESSEIPGKYFFVTSGTVNADTGWVSSVADPDTFVIGTDAISFYQFSGAGSYTAGTGLTLTGTQFAMAADQLLPSQTGNSGKFLSTDGTSASWATMTAPNDGTLTLTVSGTGLSGSASFTADQAGNSTFTVVSNATSANTISTIVARDGSGNFSAGVITATGFSGPLTGNVTGNASGSAATFTSTTQNSQFNSVGVGTAGSGTAGEIRATNNITAYYSDARLKTKIADITSPLAKIRQIETMLYHANETAVALGYDASIIEVGVSAQSVQLVQPEAVAPAPIDEKYLTVRYERLVPLLIEAIKELDVIVAKLVD